MKHSQHACRDYLNVIPVKDRIVRGVPTYRGKLQPCRYRHNARCVKRGMLTSHAHGAKPQTCRSLLARGYCPQGKG